MPRFTNLHALQTFLHRQVDAALSEQVADKVRLALYEHAHSDVYDVYEPRKYDRRYALSDPAFMESVVSGGKLTVSNNAPFDTRYNTAQTGVGLADLVSGGNGAGGFTYNYPDRGYYRSRPYLENAFEDLAGGKAIEALKAGLRNRGLTVK